MKQRQTIPPVPLFDTCPTDSRSIIKGLLLYTTMFVQQCITGMYLFYNKKTEDLRDPITCLSLTAGK